MLQDQSGWRIYLTASTRWAKISDGDGIAVFRLNSWTDFFDFLEEQIFYPTSASRHSYIWRGQQSSEWSLSASLDRLFQQLGLIGKPQEELEIIANEHLEAFKAAARGRRGQNPAKLDNNE